MFGVGDGYGMKCEWQNEWPGRGQNIDLWYGI